MIYSIADIRIKCKFEYEKMMERSNRFLVDTTNNSDYIFEISPQEIKDKMVKYPHLSDAQNEVVSSIVGQLSRHKI